VLVKPQLNIAPPAQRGTHSRPDRFLWKWILRHPSVNYNALIRGRRGEA